MVSKRLRYEVLRRDNHACRYCGATAPETLLTVDHVVPQALGGVDTGSNLVAACQDCNDGKAATAPDSALVDDVNADAIRWSRAREAAAEVIRRERDQLRRSVNFVLDSWKTAFPSGPAPDANAVQSVSNWFQRGLTSTDMIDLIEIVKGRYLRRRLPKRDLWTYFAGCCWNRLTEIEELAQAVIDREDESE